MVPSPLLAAAAPVPSPLMAPMIPVARPPAPGVPVAVPIAVRPFVRPMVPSPLLGAMAPVPSPLMAPMVPFARPPVPIARPMVPSPNLRAAHPSSLAVAAARPMVPSPILGAIPSISQQLVILRGRHWRRWATATTRCERFLLQPPPSLAWRRSLRRYRRLQWRWQWRLHRWQCRHQLS